MAKNVQIEPKTLSPESQLQIIILSAECEGLKTSVLRMTEELSADRASVKTKEKRLAECETDLRTKLEQIQILGNGGHVEDLFVAAAANKPPIETFDGMKLADAVRGSDIPAATIETLRKAGFKTGKDLREWAAGLKPRHIDGVSDKMQRDIAKFIEGWMQDRTRAAGEPPKPQPYQKLAEPAPKSKDKADKPEPGPEQKKLVEEGLSEIKNRAKVDDFDADNLTPAARKSFIDEVNDALDTRLKLAELKANGSNRMKLLDFTIRADEPRPDKMHRAQLLSLITRISSLSKHAVEKLMKQPEEKA